MNKAKALNLALKWFSQNFAADKGGKDFALPLTTLCVDNTWLFATQVTSNDWDTDRIVCAQLQGNKIVKITAREFGALVDAKESNKIPSAVAYLAQFGVVAKQRLRKPNVVNLSSTRTDVVKSLTKAFGLPDLSCDSRKNLKYYEFLVPNLGSIVATTTNDTSFGITIYNGEGI